MPANPSPDEIKADAGELRGQLVKRLAVAGAIVALLLGILAVFDRLVTNPEESEEPVFSKPVPVPPKKVLTQPVTPALPEPAAPVDPPPPPQVEEQAVLPPAEEKPKVVPEASPAIRSSVPVPKAPASAVAKASPPSDKPALPVTAESTAAPTIAPEPPVPSARPAPPARVIEPAASPVRRLFSGFIVQAGVFSSAQRAEELQAKLQLGGLPATLETRVQVGPFKTRQEAEAAQEKLRQMGIESILVPPKGAKN